MAQTKGYLVIDIGTGNVRVAVTDQQANVLHIERGNMQYVKDNRYPDALHFDPDQLWNQIIILMQLAIGQVPDCEIAAITASSQREGIVLLDQEGKSLTGLPNHDHRGREWEDTVEDKNGVYTLTGRYPSSLFSALKITGIRNRRPELYERFATMLSISDWAQFRLCGVKGYEHAQASETLLYDVAGKAWSAGLCAAFGISPDVLPPLHASGTILGEVLPAVAGMLSISPKTVVVAGGSDTQLAIKSTQPAVGDIIIVSGTTTPVTKIVSEYITDDQARTWTNRHIDHRHFIIEANAGVTGLNYQRLKEIFYPNEGYEVIEEELALHPQFFCTASLGSLVASERSPLLKGGFIFNTPVSHELTRAAFVRATLWDIACCIKENFEVLCSVTAHRPDFFWACGGGFQSRVLRQFIVDLTGSKVLIRKGYQHASVVGGALVCSEALDISTQPEPVLEEVIPQTPDPEQYAQWKGVRTGFMHNAAEELS